MYTSLLNATTMGCYSGYIGCGNEIILHVGHVNVQITIYIENIMNTLDLTVKYDVDL